MAAGADVNARFRGPHEETPLHWAASSDDVAVLDALLDAGADIDAPGAVIGGGPPLADATAFGAGTRPTGWSNAERRPPLFSEAALGLMDRLEAYGDQLSAEEVNRAFWGACHGGRTDRGPVPARSGAELNWIPPWEPLTPLDTAATSGSAELVTWLHARGARTASQLRGD